MHRARRWVVVFGSAAALAATSLVTPGPAQAAAGYGRCESGEFCAFEKKNGKGIMCSWEGNDRDWRGEAPFCRGFSKPKSFYNHGKQAYKDAVVTFERTRYRDAVSCIPRGYKGNTNGRITISSHRWEVTCN